jgi:hypothetical protein
MSTPRILHHDIPGVGGTDPQCPASSPAHTLILLDDQEVAAVEQPFDDV